MEFLQKSGKFYCRLTLTYSVKSDGNYFIRWNSLEKLPHYQIYIKMKNRELEQTVKIFIILTYIYINAEMKNRKLKKKL